MNTKLGTELTVEEQQAVLAAFPNRHTEEHVPQWVRIAGRSYEAQFSDDADWLAHTLFAINSDGSLAKWSLHCESSPTWPRNPELRKASIANPAKSEERGLFISQTLLDKVGDHFLATCTDDGVWTFRSAERPPKEITLEDVEAGILEPKSNLVQELIRYLDGLRITSDNIGQVRSECYVSWSSRFNEIVRDETARRENQEPKIFGEPH